MSTTFSQIFAALDQLEDDTIQAAIVGADDGAGIVEAAAKATEAYKGVTGATRAGTVAYVSGADVDSSSVFDQAVDAVAEHNPEHVLAEEADEPGADEIVLTLTVPTDYIDLIESQLAGTESFIGPTMDAQAPAVQVAVERRLAEVMR